MYSSHSLPLYLSLCVCMLVSSVGLLYVFLFVCIDANVYVTFVCSRLLPKISKKKSLHISVNDLSPYVKFNFKLRCFCL